MNKDIIIAIPAYNEEENIGALFDKMIEAKVFDKADVLVVNDGSSDRTEEICRQYGVNVITHVYNLGYGGALKTAYKYAVRNDYKHLVQMDADGQHDVCNINLIYDELIEGKRDIVIGSRFLKGSYKYKSPLHKRIVVAFFNLMIRMATKQKITDPTSGLQGLSSQAVKYYAGYNKFSIDYPDANMVIQMILNDFNVGEIPAVMHPRTAGVSMHSGIYKPIKYIIKMIISTSVVILREKLAQDTRPSGVNSEKKPEISA